MINSMKYTNKLKEFRLKIGLTQKQVSQQLKLNNSQDRISLWEHGTKLPSLRNLLKLCNIYQIDLKDLYTDLDQDIN